MTGENALKACPFCGPKGKLEVNKDEIVQCRRCGCEQTRAYWNTRASGWEDIATAPKDGRYILVAGSNFDGGMAVVCWDDWNWMLDDGKNFEIPVRAKTKLTHWQPLPFPPEGPTT